MTVSIPPVLHLLIFYNFKLKINKQSIKVLDDSTGVYFYNHGVGKALLSIIKKYVIRIWRDACYIVK